VFVQPGFESATSRTLVRWLRHRSANRSAFKGLGLKLLYFYVAQRNEKLQNVVLDVSESKHQLQLLSPMLQIVEKRWNRCAQCYR